MAERNPKRGLNFWVIAGVAAVAGVAYLSFRTASSDGDNDALQRNDSEANCAENWMMCRDNADLVNYSSKADAARRACIAAVNGAGQYGHPKWCSGWLCEDFASYRRGVDAPDEGLITLIDNHVQVLNSSGAWVHSTAYCTYNIRTEKVIALNINAN
jgi:hypothetical protein